MSEKETICMYGPVWPVDMTDAQDENTSITNNCKAKNISQCARAAKINGNAEERKKSSNKNESDLWMQKQIVAVRYEWVIVITQLGIHTEMQKSNVGLVLFIFRCFDGHCVLCAKTKKKRETYKRSSGRVTSDGQCARVL